ncbi:MAG: hypothetical protein HQ491_10280 [Bacteroidetes bacterium]|nr:hypothetical protein [Bacteroidota bacterium]
MKEKPYTVDTFSQDVEEIISSCYSSRPEDVRLRSGRFHMAVKILLSEYGLDDVDIGDSVIQDSRDQGIDYFFV